MRLFENTRCAVLIAVGLMLFGCIMPFLMVIHLVESTFFLNFLSYTASLVGMMIGMTAIAMRGVAHKSKDSAEEDFYKK